MRSAKQLLILLCLFTVLSACSTSQPNKQFIIEPPSESQIENSVKKQVYLTLNAFTPIAG